jgi:hypothetical protein
MLSTRFFIVTTLCAFMLLTALGLLALTIEQLSNVARNLVCFSLIDVWFVSHLLPRQLTRKSIGRGTVICVKVVTAETCEYWWIIYLFLLLLYLCFSFDRGIVTNMLEFCGVPGYTVDYYTQFDLPTQSRTSPDATSSSRRSSPAAGASGEGKDGLELRHTELEPTLRRRPTCGDAVDVADVV